jgi:hypothetical protein
MKDPPMDKNRCTLNHHPLTNSQCTLVIAQNSDQPVNADLIQHKLTINTTLADPKANIGHVSANYKHNLVPLTEDAGAVELVLAHNAAIEKTICVVNITAQNLKKQQS